MVSIPFKRERLSEHSMAWVGKNSFLFQFPSNGKGFPNDLKVEPEVVAEPVEFQFPSNGKGFPNMVIRRYGIDGLLVSIPFKRERLSEHVWFRTGYSGRL